ncbi:hypothetical protein F5879DRAFT_995322 [Lentinula edodes]|nr:hypothetical protein F5879DRAFT_995322 [Lentinula edodes]
MPSLRNIIPGLSINHRTIQAPIQNLNLPAGVVMQPESATAQLQQGGHKLVLEYLKSLQLCDCLWNFWFYADKIADLVVALCIPDPFRTPSRSKFNAVEALALLFAQFRMAGDEHLLVQRFDHSQSAISEVVNALMIFLDDHWKHLLEPFDENPLLKPVKLAEYANAIHVSCPGYNQASPSTSHMLSHFLSILVPPQDSTTIPLIYPSH